MTDNPQWQEGQPPPPPPNNPEPHGTAGQPYAGGPAQPPNAPQQGDGWQNQQGQPQHGQPQSGWSQQGQPQQGQPQGGWQGQGAYQHNQQPAGDERTWMILAHLSAPIAMIVSAGWLTILGPLLVWLFKKDSSPAVRQAAAGAFNFNLSFWLMTVVGWICFFTIVLIPVALIIWVVVFIVAVYTHLRGAWLASKGEIYKYPFQLPVLS
ncbi:DUF4870 domain-containing protein [Ornithinimicrobium faecis]|uniref:DUF4870 domain-containing protein n=1 Tax=Ornithinimicrobium faecis TaxID=2934158 RepID=A0ABY4YP17_9MICO|nr:DUF4870 domain-containing protein [Ornithinimicrobium sp. HY1793]USQ78504.1 DUF4870 domain-containing protein [Ornithinimicrobium sp. HY1793]